MRVTTTCSIVNKETAAIFKMSLKNGDNFFDRVCVKISVLIKDSLLNNAYALVTLYQLHDDMLNLCAYFDDEMDKFEGQIEKKKTLDVKKINFISQYTQDLPCSNAFSVGVIELIEVFDKLISTVKLLHLGGLLESRATLYALKQRYQKNINAFLSKILMTASSKNHSFTVLDVINEKHCNSGLLIDLKILKEALNAPYAPGFSLHVQSQLSYQLNQKIQQQDTLHMEVQS